MEIHIFIHQHPPNTLSNHGLIIHQQDHNAAYLFINKRSLGRRGHATQFVLRAGREGKRFNKFAAISLSKRISTAAFSCAAALGMP